MKILPDNEKKKSTQSVVVADKDGVLQSFGLKKKELTVSDIFIKISEYSFTTTLFAVLEAH